MADRVGLVATVNTVRDVPASGGKPKCCSLWRVRCSLWRGGFKGSDVGGSDFVVMSLCDFQALGMSAFLANRVVQIRGRFLLVERALL